MGVDEVIAGIRSENVNTPLGRLTKNGSEFPLRVSGKPVEVSRFPSMVIGQRNGRAVLLGEVADVVDGIEEPRSLALVNGVPAIALDIQKQSRANTVSVVELVKKEIGTDAAGASPRDEDRDRPGRLDHDPGLRGRRPDDLGPRRDPDHLHRLLLPQLVALHGDHRTHPPDLRHLLLHRHELHGDDAQRDDADGAVPRHRPPHRRRDRGPGEHRPAPRARAGPFRGGPGRDRGDRARGDRHHLLHRRRLRAGGVHEGDRRALLLPVRDHRGLRGAGLPLRVVHPRPDALLQVGRPRHRAKGETASRRPDPRPVQRLVRPDGRPVSVRDRVGPRASQDDARPRDAGVHRGHRGVRLAEDGVLHGGGPGRVPDQLQVRAGRIPRRDAGPRSRPSFPKSARSARSAAPSRPSGPGTRGRSGTAWCT